VLVVKKDKFIVCYNNMNNYIKIIVILL